MAYSKAKLKSSGDKVSPCFRPFSMVNLSDRFLSIRTLQWVYFKHIHTHILTIFNGWNLEVINGEKNFEAGIQTQSSLAVGTPLHRVLPFAPFLTHHTSFLGLSFLTRGWNLFNKVSLSQTLRKRMDRRASYLI
jgi:hypothetical protein